MSDTFRWKLDEELNSFILDQQKVFEDVSRQMVEVERSLEDRFAEEHLVKLLRSRGWTVTKA